MKLNGKNWTSNERLAFWISMGVIFFGVIDTARADGAPALWALSDADNRVYLFGTFHLLPENANWTSPAVLAAMDEAAITVTEADTASPEAQAAMRQLVGQYGLNAPGTTLSDVLGEDRAASLFEIAARFNVPVEALQPLRPWLAFLSVTQAAYVAAGFNPALGVEKRVLDAAAEDGDKVEHLETLARQIAALASLDDENVESFYDVSLEEFDQMNAQLEAGLSAWLEGDIDTLDRSLVSPVREASPRAFELIFAERNREWVDRIRAYLDGDTDTFVAVGAGHLVGDDSVIDMLTDAGFDVVRLQ